MTSPHFKSANHQMALPPLQPTYILRGQAAQVHALEFSPTNSHLLSGDAEGYVICWSLASKRATASWRPHTTAVLGIAWWTQDIIVTHGRDSQFHVWELGPDLDTILPMDRHANPELPTGKTPKLIHSMTVNTLNFCAFTWTRYRVSGIGLSYLLALPHTLSSEAIDIFQIVISRNSESDSPTVKTYRKTTIPAPDLNDPKTGLTMCLFFQKDHKLIAGYESGHTIVYAMETTVESKNEGDMALWKYKPSYISHAHSQPILSVHGMPDNKLYITTAADSKLVTHQIPRCNSGLQAVVTSEPYNSLNTKHSGQQGLSIRDDGLLLATAGWDSKGRVYKAPIHNLSDKEAKLAKPKEIAVLKWHKEGCYCTAFAHVSSSNGSEHHASDIHRNMEGQLEEEDKVLTRTGSSLMESTSERRDHKAKNTHWLALGSKDGKISLWDIL